MGVLDLTGSVCLMENVCGFLENSELLDQINNWALLTFKE